MKLILIQLAVFFSVLAPSYLLNRKREVDSQGNPILKAWGAGVIGLVAASFCGWKAVEALHDPLLSKTDDATAMFIMSSICLFVGIASLNFKITLFKNHIEQQYLFFFHKKYSLAEILSIEGLGKNVARLIFANGGKIGIIWIYSGRTYFLDKLRTAIK